MPEKSEKIQGPFYALGTAELRHLYAEKLLDAATYILLIVKATRAAGWKWTFRVQQFCEDWGLKERTFYRAVSKLKKLGKLHWETRETITVWHGSEKIATSDSEIATSDSEIATSDSEIATSDSETSLEPKPSNASRNSPNLLLNSYQIFLHTLSEKERKKFEEFGLKKASLLPKPPQLPLRWIEANWQELHEQFKSTPEATAATTEATDWTQHPDWESWLELMRSGVPRFVALGTCFDRKMRRAIADWAWERGLIWGHES